jgi:O-antigen ligase
MPGTIQRIECVIQAGVDQNSAVRELLYFLTAILLCITSFNIAFAGNRCSAPVAIYITIMTYSAIFIACDIFKISQPIPDFLVFSGQKSPRISFLMQNPTWVWPYLLPGILTGFWLFLKSEHAGHKGILLLSLGLPAYVLLRNQQRGALLLLIVLCLGVIINMLIDARRRFQKNSIKISLILVAGLLPLATGLWLAYGGYKSITRGIRELGLGHRLAKVNFSSQPRIEIWETAWQGITEKPWLGHGFANWYEDYGKLALEANSKLLDTAHNNIIHSLFELGFPHTILNFGLIIAFAIFSYWYAEDRRRQRWLLILAGAGYMAVIGVQEFNFVRSIYYTNAVFYGWLTGLGLSSLRYKNGATSTKALNPSNKFNYHRVASTTLLILGVICCTFGILSLGWFSLAGYQYEANVHQNFSPKVRWLRPFGTVTHIGSADQTQSYAVYEVPKYFAKKYKLDPFDNEPPEHYQFSSDRKNYISVRQRTLFSLPSLVEFDTSRGINGRRLSAMLSWPPVITFLPFVWSKGLYDWEEHPGYSGKVRWCGIYCSFQMRYCQKGQKRQLAIRASRNKWDSEEVTIQISQKSPKQTEHHDSYELTLTPERSHANIEFDPRLPLVLETSPPFIPGGADERRLGVLLTESRCLPKGDD